MANQCAVSPLSLIEIGLQQMPLAAHSVQSPQVLQVLLAAGAVTTSVEERFFQLREEVTKKGKDKRQIGLRLTESGSLIAFVVTKHNRGVPASPYSSSPTKCSRQRAAPSAAQSFARRALSCTNGRCRLKPSLERVVTRNSPLRGKSGRRATSRIFHRQAARGSECDVRIGRGAAARFGSRSAQG